LLTGDLDIAYDITTYGIYSNEQDVIYFKRINWTINKTNLKTSNFDSLPIQVVDPLMQLNK